MHKIRRLEFSGVVVFVKKLQKFVTAVSQCTSQTTNKQGVRLQTAFILFNKKFGIKIILALLSQHHKICVLMPILQHNNDNK